MVLDISRTEICIVRVSNMAATVPKHTDTGMKIPFGDHALKLERCRENSMAPAQGGYRYCHAQKRNTYGSDRAEVGSTSHRDIDL